MSNLALNLVASAARIPDRAAAITDEDTMTYAELDAASARFATLLEREGIGAGDRVGVMLPNIAAAPITYYGIWRLGAIAVPMNPLMQGREVQFYLSNTDAKALIGSSGFAGAATEGAESAGAKLWLVDDAELARLTADLPAVRQSRRACRLRHCRRAAHLGNHRHAEGCRADPRKPWLQPGSHPATPREDDR